LIDNYLHVNLFKCNWNQYLPMESDCFLFFLDDFRIPTFIKSKSDLILDIDSSFRCPVLSGFSEGTELANVHSFLLKTFPPYLISSLIAYLKYDGRTGR
jgi:hypothetical protein